MLQRATMLGTMPALICILLHVQPFTTASDYFHGGFGDSPHRTLPLFSHNTLKTHPNWNLLPHDICGRRALNEMDQPQLSNTTYFGKYPWMVFLFDIHESKQYDKPSCGGTIINNNYVMTTEYCCKQMTIKTSRVRIGEYDINHGGEECNMLGCADPVKNLRIKEIIFFPRNNSTYLHDDICLIRLKSQIRFNRFVRPICLPINENGYQQIGEGTEVEFAGLTRTGSILQNIKWPVISDKSCNYFYHKLKNSKICSAYKQGQDSLDLNLCFENRGHGLMTSSIVNGNTKTSVLGLYCQVSQLSPYNYAMCVMRLPKVFTRVSDYNMWILDSIKK